ncbi:hypothetical protein ACFQZX_00095 [Mucilaginibacter litoreus]|uniref:Uncharacterized protein n=1 Tax=Mucilaginibacter litoreus TaxID=1048221 RepID=A0ABW3AMC7_9SPHI
MPNVTEKDIIDFLENKVVYHNREIQRIRDILSALSGSYIENTENANQSLENISAEMLRTENDRTVFRAVVKPLIVPDNYRSQLPMSLKISYVLDKINAGMKDDIANYIVSLQPDLQLDRLTKHLSTVLSELKSKSLLSAVKEGRKYRYSLIRQQ